MDYRALEPRLSLEQQADLILSRDDWQHRSWLSQDQLNLREYKEVPVGLVQGRTYPGQFSRAYNPRIGRRPKLFAPGIDPWHQLLYEYYS
jgi:hypothetical protein